MPSPVHPYSEYGVALRTLRSSRTWLGYGLLLCVAGQILGFLLMWTTQQPYESLQAKYRTRFDELHEQVAPKPVPATVAATHGSETASSQASETREAVGAITTAPEESFAQSEQGKKLNIRKQWEITYTAAVPLTQILGLIVVSSQVIVTFLTLLLILIAQAPGVVHMTRALIWSILLACMVFPWQYIARDFPFRGVLYGYQEMLGMIGPHVVAVPVDKVYAFQKLLVYVRFLIWPAVSLVVLLIVSERFRAGIMLAVGHPLQSMIQSRPPLTPGMTPGGVPTRKIG